MTLPSVKRALLLAATAMLAAMTLVAASPAPVEVVAGPGTTVELRYELTEDGLRTDHGAHSRAELLARSGPLDDLTTYVAAARAAVELQGFETFGNARCPDCEDEPGGAEAFGVPIGDVTGDGVDEVGVHRIDHGTGAFSTTIHDGLDGSELWAWTPEGEVFGFSYVVGDADGDGDADVVRYAIRFGEVAQEGTCTAAACVFTIDDSWATTVEVLDGATGEVLFSRAFEGSARGFVGDSFTYTPVGGAYVAADGFELLNVFVFPTTGNVVGSPAVDLVLEASSLRYAGAFADTAVFPADTYALGGGSVVAADTDISVHDLAAASTTTLVQSSNGNTLTFAHRVGDLEGDGHDELLLETSAWSNPALAGCYWASLGADCGELGEFDVSYELVGGGDLDSRWVTDAVDGWMMPAGADLDGDAVADLTTLEFGDDISTGALSGATGERLWLVGGDRYLVPTASLDGGAGADLVGVGIEDELTEDDTLSLTARIERLDGATGELLGSDPITDVEIGDGFVMIDIRLGFDGNGDAVPDAHTDVGSIDFETWEHTSQSIISSGADGAVLRDLSARDGYVSGFLDADGDGADDVLLTSYRFDEESYASTVDLTVESIATDEVLHAHAVAADDAFGVAMAGPAGTDLVVSWIRFGPELAGGVDVVELAGGEVRWSQLA